jgi:hypothetical protein
MEKARKTKVEKEEREKKAFVKGENWRVDNCVTVPKPFNLSYNTRLGRSKDREKKKEISPNDNES